MEFRKVDCVGMVGKLPTPDGPQNFWDTGKKVNEDALNRIKALQYASFYAPGDVKRDARNKLKLITIQITKEFNVYAVKLAGIADDGRILVNTPWFEEQI